MGGYILGLDLGANSIGWALLDESKPSLINAGVRVFPEGVDAFDTAKEKSRTQERRIKRGMRRQIARRARRKRGFRELLIAHGLFPADAPTQNTVLAENPYELRARGLDHPLTAHQFGRILLHLNARRGFLSNSKADKSKAKENSEMLKEISALAREIEESGHRTLGEHLASLGAKPGETPAHRLRGRHTRRDMLRREFELLWTAQQSHHPQLLTDDLKNQIDDPEGDETWWMRGAIFGQRKLYWPSSMIGRCEYEPKERRCLKAERIAQRYRLLSEVNNLKYIDPDSGKVSRLDDAQRVLLLDKLSQKREMTFDAIRKELGMLATVQFNLEKGERAKLKGHVVDYVMAKESPFGAKWWEMPEESKDRIVNMLADSRNSDDQIVREAIETWGLPEDEARALAGVNLPAGYLSLSRKAIEKLLPHMEKGQLLMTDDGTPCALTGAGYLRPDQRVRKVLERLPEPPDLPNPVVRQAMHEVRRVVNAIVREYGRPARIHVELARNIKMSPDDRDAYNKARSDREKLRSAAADAIRAEAPTARLSRELIDKYLLWQDQGGICVYCGNTISLRQLLSGDIDIDHILPRWRSLDDSFANKVVCFRAMNHEKGDRTPFEWLGGDPGRYEALKQRIRSLPWRKRTRFTQEALDTDEFSARQLVDTAYITRAAVDYLRCLVEQPHHVLGGKGSYTVELRHLWGLETILSELSDSPAWAAQADLRPGEKNRADHRHHAIDAIVVALTDQRRLQALSRLYKSGESGAEVLPWPDLRDTVKSVAAKINVSHRVQRRVSGALHDETLYGKTDKPGEFVVRKSLESLTPAMVEDIRDPTIRKLVIDRLTDFGLKWGRKSKDKIKKEVWKEPLRMLSGVPIKKVRLIKRDETIRPLRSNGDSAHVKPGSTHHVCIFQFAEGGKTKREAIFVTMLDAIERVKRREPIIQRTHPKRPEARFLMTLSPSEVILIKHGGRERVFRFETAAATSEQMWFRDVNFSGRSAQKNGQISKNPGTFDARKITVDPLGRIRWAND
jgi:CRISPR-associated endonuclease Csn1